jgi:hypothetical protein
VWLQAKLRRERRMAEITFYQNHPQACRRGVARETCREDRLALWGKASDPR